MTITTLTKDILPGSCQMAFFCLLTVRGKKRQVYSLRCEELDEKIDTTLMSVRYMGFR